MINQIYIRHFNIKKHPSNCYSCLTIGGVFQFGDFFLIYSPNVCPISSGQFPSFFLRDFLFLKIISKIFNVLTLSKFTFHQIISLCSQT